MRFHKKPSKNQIKRYYKKTTKSPLKHYYKKTPKSSPKKLKSQLKQPLKLQKAAQLKPSPKSPTQIANKNVEIKNTVVTNRPLNTPTRFDHYRRIGEDQMKKIMSVKEKLIKIKQQQDEKGRVVAPFLHLPVQSAWLFDSESDYRMRTFQPGGGAQTFYKPRVLDKDFYAFHFDLVWGERRLAYKAKVEAKDIYKAVVDKAAADKVEAKESQGEYEEDLRLKLFLELDRRSEENRKRNEVVAACKGRLEAELRDRGSVLDRDEFKALLKKIVDRVFDGLDCGLSNPGGLFVGEKEVSVVGEELLEWLREKKCDVKVEEVDVVRND